MSALPIDFSLSSSVSAIMPNFNLCMGDLYNSSKCTDLTLDNINLQTTVFGDTCKYESTGANCTQSPVSVSQCTYVTDPVTPDVYTQRHQGGYTASGKSG